MILFILQNAYRSEKYKFKNNAEWFKDLARSHTGRRLMEMIPDGAEAYVINSTPLIGDDAKSCFKSDTGYMKLMIEQYNPMVICACGKIAQEGCEKLGVTHIKAPHPAWRRLSKEITSDIRRQIYEQTRS
jgi:hypothetical protein